MGIIEFLRVKKGAPASQIAEIEANLEKVRAERKAAEAIVENHGQRRADMLMSDASSADIAALDAAVNLAQIDLERLEMVELELIDRLDHARDSVDRSKRAAMLENSAAQIEQKTQALDAAISAVAAAFTDLVKAVPDNIGVQKDADRFLQDATPADLARAILASGLFRAAPEAFEMTQPRNRSPRPACVERMLSVLVVNQDGALSRYNPGIVGEDCEIPPTADAAQQVIVERLRAQARRLRQSDDARMAAE